MNSSTRQSLRPTTSTGRCRTSRRNIAGAMSGAAMASTHKTRSFLNLAMLCALNRPQELKTHVRGALTNGATREEIREVFMQVAIYCGVPAGVDAFRNAREVFAELDKEVTREPDPMLKGKWALVTGATAGLGLAVAESLAGAGANIVLHDLRRAAGTQRSPSLPFRRRGRERRGRSVAAFIDRSHDGRTARPLRRDRYPGEQRGGPAFCAGRDICAGAMGRSAGRQSVGAVSPDPPRIARDEDSAAGAASSIWPRSIRPAPSPTASIT